MLRFGVALLAALFMSLVPVGTALARSVVAPVPPVRPGDPPELRLESLTVRAVVSGAVAEVEVEQRFVNRAAVPAEGTYLFPLPAGAAVSGFSMLVDGQEYHAEVLGADQARDVYESIVRRNRDPALLQYVGRGLLQARIFPVPPGAERQIRIRYTQVLAQEGGLTEFQFPIGRDPVPQVALEVDLGQVDGGTVYSPSHVVKVARHADGRALASFAGNRVSGDFRLFFADPTTDLDVHLLTYKPAGEDGYFLLLASPPPEGQTAPVSKDVLLVVDLSGSMAGTKFEQARGAARQVLSALLPGDRFAVVGFHSDTQAFADTLQGQAAVPRAIEWVDQLRLGGATNIADAMARAQRLAGPGGDRPQVIILLTDGQPTAGEQNPDRIVEAVRSRATPSQRIFTFGLGYDVNTLLLDALAQENRGRSEYVKPEENLESAAARLWSRIGQPVLSDLELAWSGVQVEAVYPRPLPDLYLGGQLVLTGRYREGGAGVLTLEGTRGGRKRTYRFDHLQFSAANVDRDYIARLWANRRVGYLLGEIRLRGPNPELVAEVTDLAQRYAIVTPYTAFFVNEPGQPPVGPGPSPRTGPGTATSAPAGATVSPQVRLETAMKAPTSGAAAVEAASAVNQIREARSLADVQPTEQVASQVRTAGEKSFVVRAGVWTDTLFSGGPILHLTTGSERYFAVVRARPELGRYLAVASPLILVQGGTVYGIDIPGQVESEPPADPGPAGGTSELPVETVSADRLRPSDSSVTARIVPTAAGVRAPAAPAAAAARTGPNPAGIVAVGIGAVAVGGWLAVRRRRTG